MMSSPTKKHKSTNPFAVKHSGERYIIEEIIGKGGHAIIVRGIDRDLKRPVALKVLRKSFNHKEDIVRRFLNEGQIMAQLNCVGVVPIYEIGQLKDNSYYFAMPLIKGQNLRQFMKQLHHAFSINDTINIFKKITKTIAVAHSEGIIHRDLKPENIMIDELGSVFIVDWGLSKYQKDDKIKEEKNTCSTQINLTIDNLTLEGQLNGTPLYMSPEQVLGLNNRTTTQSDIFCLGILLYELLVKKNPFSHDENSFDLIIKRSANLTIPTKNFLGEKIPPELRAILAKCLAFLPNERYENAGKLQQDLLNYIAEKPVQAYRTDFFENCRKFLKRNQKILTLSFIILGIITNVIIIQYLNGRSYLESHHNLHKLAKTFNDNIDKAYQQYENLQAYQNRLYYIYNDESRQKFLEEIVILKSTNAGLWQAIQGRFQYLYPNSKSLIDKQIVNKYLILWLVELEKIAQHNQKRAEQVYSHIQTFINKYKVNINREVDIRLQYFKRTLNNPLAI